MQFLVVWVSSCVFVFSYSNIDSTSFRVHTNVTVMFNVHPFVISDKLRILLYE
jgi:hypothetical protein